MDLHLDQGMILDEDQREKQRFLRRRRNEQDILM
jgi:hypothetical protein